MSTREEMIDQLVKDDIAFIKDCLANDDEMYLTAVLVRAEPYSKWSDLELELELAERELEG